MGEDRKGKKLILFYDDGLKVIRREITVTGEDETFLYSRGGYYWNKNYIRRMEEVNSEDRG